MGKDDKSMKNRPFKFRIWSIERKQWLYDSDIYYHLLKHHEGKEVIQQFTGLLDSTGREIYEGDILDINVKSTILLYSSGLYRASVYWDNHSLKYGLNIIPCSGGYCKYNPELYEDRGREYKIIGNIFENRSILEGYIK